MPNNISEAPRVNKDEIHIDLANLNNNTNNNNNIDNPHGNNYKEFELEESIPNNGKYFKFKDLYALRCIQLKQFYYGSWVGNTSGKRFHMTLSSTVHDNKYDISFNGSPSLLSSLDEIPVNLTIAYIGDTGLKNKTLALYALIKNESVEAIVHGGDFDYKNKPDSWDESISSILGNIPIFAVAGNHDNHKGQFKKYQQIIKNRAIKSNIADHCTGVIGIAQICTYKGLLFVQISPDIFDDYSKFDWPKYIRHAFDTYRSKWKIIVWHKNLPAFQTGDKDGHFPEEIYSIPVSRGALIITAHEHSYERSYLLDSLFPTVHMKNRKQNLLELEPDASAVIVQGLGGKSVRPEKTNTDYWAAKWNKDTGADDAAALICKYNYNGNQNLAYCYLKDTKQGIKDWFIVDVTKVNP